MTNRRASAAPIRLDAQTLRDFDGVLLNVVNARPPSIYFSAIAPGSSGADLYRLGADGSFEAIPVRTDAGAASGSRAGANGGYMVFNERLYFFADTDAGPAGLFSLGPDGSVTPVSGIRAAPDGVNAHFTIFDKLYFVADGPQGDSVYSIDWDGNVTSLDSSGWDYPPILVGDNVNSYSNDNGFVFFDGAIYFSAYSGGAPLLFRLDPGSNTPVLVNAQVSYVGEDGGFFVYNNALYFNGYDASSGGEYVYRLDAGSATPTRLTDGFGHDVGHSFLTPANFYQYDPSGGLSFVAHSTADGADVLHLNQNGTILVPHSNGQPFTGAGLQNGFIGFARNLYFPPTTTSTSSTSSPACPWSPASTARRASTAASSRSTHVYFFAEVGGITQLMSLDVAGQTRWSPASAAASAATRISRCSAAACLSRVRLRRASSWC